MPRFGLDASPSPPPVERYAPSASASASVSSTMHRNRSSLLSCLSPDGRSVHLVHNNRIETHALPLTGTSEDASRFPVISTLLPIKVDDASIVELLCVEGDSMPLPEFKEDIKLTLLPLLCVYTRHAVYILKIGYTYADAHAHSDAYTNTIQDLERDQTQIEGQVLTLTQPFQSHLFPSSTIVRVRPAPHRRLGYATFEPPGSLAALVSNGGGDSCLLLYHSKSQTVTQPLTFGTEAVFGEPDFADFCFCQSNAQSLLVSLSIHLLKSNGQVYGVSPIIFDGCMIPKALYQEARDLLDDFSLGEEAKQQQCLAATYFLKEVFEEEQSGDYMVARLHGGNANRSTFWPVQLQGPLIDANSTVTTTTSMEPFFARNLVGFAICGKGGVQVCVTPPTTLLPRFAYETSDHARVLNEQLQGIMVEQITKLPCTALIRDPVLDTMMHCVSDRGVTTLTSHALRHFSASLDSDNSPPPPQTKAWMAVDLTNDSHVQGAVVSGDAHLGHVLIVFLSTGQLTAINLTETRVRYETIAQQQQPLPPVKDEALQTMEATPAFHEQLGPVVDKIEAGLLGMSKLVGTATHPKDLDAGLLATALLVRQRCEHDLVVHLKYLQRMSALRLSELKKVMKGQVTQLQSIQESLKIAKSKTKAIRQSMVQSEEKSRHLAERSSSLLQASKDLRPALTQADVQYFALLKRIQAQCQDWETKVDQLAYTAQTLDSSDVSIELDPMEERDVRTLLRGQKDLINQAQDRVQATQGLVKELVQQTGVVVLGEERQ